MKFIICLAIALCFLLLLAYTHDVAEEVAELREGYKLLNEEIRANRAYIGVVDDKTQHVIDESQRMIDEVREIVNIPYSQFIPIDKGWLAIREEEK